MPSSSSGTVGAVSLAWALRSSWEKQRPDLGGLVVAGVLGGYALSIKQSGFDAFATGAVVVAVVTWRGAWNSHDRRLALPALFAGLALPLGRAGAAR